MQIPSVRGCGGFETTLGTQPHPLRLKSQGVSPPVERGTMRPIGARAPIKGANGEGQFQASCAWQNLPHNPGLSSVFVSLFFFLFQLLLFNSCSPPLFLAGSQPPGPSVLTMLRLEGNQLP